MGSAAVQLAKTKRAKILGTVTKTSGLEQVKHLPVDHWITLDQEDLVLKTRELTEGRCADLILDTVGNPLFEQGLKCLARRGRQVCIASTNGPRVEFSLMDFYHKESTLKGVDSLKLSFKETGGILRDLARLVEREKIPPPTVRAIPLEESLAAYAAILEGSSREKTVIRF
ncbi:MAG: quinone oxidoreductase family protein [bacterium]